ncbi:MAG: KOW domain-containing RNA-binding protein [Oscillospiraceae bacterium]|jgi:ribosomal protein L14E/L6E/L27E|nr:KOW domain-containing RNA-binding protein [Oscillospiraceae bacterium]
METVRSPDIVFSLAGRDRGRAYVVLGTDGGTARLSDGRTRKLANPKRKSLKHLCLGETGATALAEALRAGKATDSVIRKELARFRGEAGMTEEVRQLVKRRRY